MKKTRLLSMFIAVMMVLLITSSAMAEHRRHWRRRPSSTGGAAQYGISVEQGAQLYIDQINAELAASGSDTRFELIFEDNGGDDTEPQNVYYRLTESKGAVAFLGDVLSSNCKVVAECANEDGTAHGNRLLHQLRNHHRSSHGIPHLLPGSLPGRGHGQLCQVQGLHQGSHPVRQR